MATTTSRPYGVAPPAFKLPDPTHVGMVRLQVSDLEQSLRYYQDVLGFRVAEHTDDVATLLAPEGERALLELHATSGIKRARRGAFGLYHFAILLPDRPSLGRFGSHISALQVRIGMADHLVSEALYLWDPDGLGIEVYADRPRVDWRQRERELVMTTDPLDFDAVRAASGNEAWNGMPSATTIGHVHLHVGNLEEAEGFYHRALGFEKMVWSYPGALFLAAGGYHHHLGTNVWSPGPAARDDEARLIDWELIVPRREDATGAATSLRAAGYAAEQIANGFVARDPWGTTLRVVTTS